jgi:hypothetical protein
MFLRNVDNEVPGYRTSHPQSPRPNHKSHLRCPPSGYLPRGFLTKILYIFVTSHRPAASIGSGVSGITARAPIGIRSLGSHPGDALIVAAVGPAFLR